MDWALRTTGLLDDDQDTQAVVRWGTHSVFLLPDDGGTDHCSRRFLFRRLRAYARRRRWKPSPCAKPVLQAHQRVNESAQNEAEVPHEKMKRPRQRTPQNVTSKVRARYLFPRDRIQFQLRPQQASECSALKMIRGSACRISQAIPHRLRFQKSDLYNVPLVQPFSQAVVRNFR
jgi:hypothetical protein